MTLSDQSFAGVLDDLTSAAGRDAALCIAAQAAAGLAGIDGLCLIARAAKSSVVALAADRQIFACEVREPNLHRVVAAAIGGRRAIGETLVVPVHEGSGYRSVGYFWQPGRTIHPQQTDRLQLLAKSVGLAASAWLVTEDCERRLQDQGRLSSELQHRLRNNLALLRSIIRRSIETAPASSEQFALHLEGRVSALVRVQAALTAADSIGLELEELARAELIANAVQDQRCVVRGPVVRLDSKTAESLGLALHELTMNSLKFGALGVPGGRVEVTWTVTGGKLPCLHLRWTESGVTIATVAPRRRGFGQELIECTLPYEFGARTQLDFNPGGLCCQMDIPLEDYATLVEPEARRAVQGAAGM